MERFNLSDSAFRELCSFCESNLKPSFYAMRYAYVLVANCNDWGDNVVFEIRASHTSSGNPATISFDKNHHFEYR